MVLKNNYKGPGKVLEFCQADSVGTMYNTHVENSSLVPKISNIMFQSAPLHLAAGYNRTRIVQLLLQQGADVHAKDKG